MDDMGGVDDGGRTVAAADGTVRASGPRALPRTLPPSRLAEIAAHVRGILEAIGEDPDREGVRDTPLRVARMLADITGGLHRDAADVLSVEFHEEYRGIVVVRDIAFHSLCEHHLLPFFGRAAVAYQPGGGTLTGLSKLARLVDVVSRRPQVQERMTQEIVDVLTARLHPAGVLVRLEAEHLCMAMRGVSKPGATTVTWAGSGTLQPGSPLHATVFTDLNG
jgi:GTP cyclohydrolase I